MQDMENKNLERLRSATKIDPPILNSEILSPRNESSNRRFMIFSIPVAASIAVALTLVVTAKQPEPLAFPLPAAQQNESFINGSMIEAGVSFAGSTSLSDQSGTAKVWSLEPLADLDDRKLALAEILGFKGEIGSQVSQYLQKEDFQPSSFAVTESDGHWLFQNLTHTLSVDGVCVDTKVAGNCSVSHAQLLDTQLRQDASVLFSAGGFTGANQDISLEYSADGSASATATLLVDGVRSPIKWCATWYRDGVLESASGFMATPKDLGKFEIVSPKASVERAGDYSQWTSADASRLFPWPAPVGKPSAVVTSAKLTIGFYRGLLVPSYHLTGSSGTWYRDVSALAPQNK